MQLDDTLQPEIIFLICPGFKGSVSASDLLIPEGTISFAIRRDELRLQSGIFFKLAQNDFNFTLWGDAGIIVLQRGSDQIRITPDLNSEPDIRQITATWSPTQLRLFCPVQGDQGLSTKTTSFTLPPISLIQYARLNNLLPTVSFSSTEALRQTVYETLAHFQSQIPQLGAYNAFWDEHHVGRKKGQPVPKKETDIHPTLHLLLSEWALMRSIEVIPENKIAVGRIDLCFVGHVADKGPVSICVEVKHAHADDLMHGLTVQLPAYMRQKHAQYGAFVTLWYKGEWFSKPSKAAIQRIADSWLKTPYKLSRTDLENFQFALLGKSAKDPRLENIRVFIIDVTKPVQASSA
jgi:hypothetical protein